MAEPHSLHFPAFCSLHYNTAVIPFSRQSSDLPSQVQSQNLPLTTAGKALHLLMGHCYSEMSPLPGPLKVPPTSIPLAAGTLPLGAFLICPSNAKPAVAALRASFHLRPPPSILATKTAACTAWPRAEVTDTSSSSVFLLFLVLFLFWVFFGAMWLLSGSADPCPQKWRLHLSPLIRTHSFHLYPGSLSLLG